MHPILNLLRTPAKAAGNSFSLEANLEGSRLVQEMRRKSRMKDHIDSMHFSASPKSCTICGKTYSNKNTLGNHMALYHKNA